MTKHLTGLWMDGLQRLLAVQRRAARRAARKASAFHPPRTTGAARTVQAFTDAVNTALHADAPAQPRESRVGPRAAAWDTGFESQRPGEGGGRPMLGAFKGGGAGREVAWLMEWGVRAHACVPPPATTTVCRRCGSQQPAGTHPADARRAAAERLPPPSSAAAATPPPASNSRQPGQQRW